MIKTLFTILTGLTVLAAIIIAYREINSNNNHPHFELVDPEMAPPAIHEKVMKGFEIIQHTNVMLPDYVDAKLSCNNCHLEAGNTFGGKRGGISLVGVVHTYPKFSSRMNRTIDLVDRINNCFERSMNGKALERDSDAMQSILAYLDWISSPAPVAKEYSWLGLKMLKSGHQPNATNGQKDYAKYCALCHQLDGAGTVNNPPLWGPHAYNDGAGMSTEPMLASFIFYNMPYEDPFMTEEQALDIAAYLIQQRRPQYLKEK